MARVYIVFWRGLLEIISTNLCLSACFAVHLRFQIALISNPFVSELFLLAVWCVKSVGVRFFNYSYDFSNILLETFQITAVFS